MSQERRSNFCLDANAAVAAATADAAANIDYTLLFGAFVLQQPTNSALFHFSVHAFEWSILDSVSSSLDSPLFAA